MPKPSVEIIFEDDDIIAVNKPAGMFTIPDREKTEPSLKDILLQQYPQIFVVHRLDRETSGILLFAKNETAHKFYSNLFEGRKIEKYYQAIVVGTPQPVKGTIDAPIAENMVAKGTMIIHQRGKPSVTDYEVLESFKQHSLVQFQLHTGRTHQIRVHCKNIGYPIVCDTIYGDGKPILLSNLKKKFKLSKTELEEKPLLNRVALHSYQLKFINAKNKEIVLTAELPKDIRATLQQMRKLI